MLAGLVFSLFQALLALLEARSVVKGPWTASPGGVLAERSARHPFSTLGTEQRGLFTS